jgi:hypothetical protein
MASRTLIETGLIMIMPTRSPIQKLIVARKKLSGVMKFIWINNRLLIILRINEIKISVVKNQVRSDVD